MEYAEKTRPFEYLKWEDFEKRENMRPCPFCGCKKLKTYRVWYTSCSCHGVVECSSCRCDFFLLDIAAGEKDKLTDKDKETIRRAIVKRWNNRKEGTE